MIDGPQNQSLANLSSAQAVEVKLGPSPWAPMTYMMTSGNTCGTALYKHSTPMTLRSFGRFRQKPDNAKRVDNIHRPNRIDRCQHKGRSRAQPVSGSPVSACLPLVWLGLANGQVCRDLSTPDVDNTSFPPSSASAKSK